MASINNKKKDLQSTIVNLDVEAEERDLSDAEREQLALARDSLSALLREEELKYFQWAKVKDVLLGDNNTRYFQMIANGKHRKKHIYFLEHGSEKIDTQADLQKYITEIDVVQPIKICLESLKIACCL